MGTDCIRGWSKGDSKAVLLLLNILLSCRPLELSPSLLPARAVYCSPRTSPTSNAVSFLRLLGCGVITRFSLGILHSLRPSLQHICDSVKLHPLWFVHNIKMPGPLALNVL